MQGKVEICGVNTSRLSTLSQAEMDHRPKRAIPPPGKSSLREICVWCFR